MPTKDATPILDPTGTVLVKLRCNDCVKSGTAAEFTVPHYERQSPRLPEIDGLYLETRKSGGPFHSCARHKPPVILIRWQTLRNKPPAVRGSP